MNYEIVPCWLVFETDCEGRSNGNLRYATVDEDRVNKEIKSDVWISVYDEKAIKVGNNYFVLKYEHEITNLGNKVQKELKQKALDKLSKEEIRALKELGI